VDGGAMTAILITDWVVRVSSDGQIPFYGFRFALRLASKIKGPSLQARIKKFQPTADLDAIAALTAAGYLEEIDSGALPQQRKERLFKITFPKVITA
jgi:hypothetical protein